MRTIKRKRIFGGRNNLHKRKRKKSLKKIRGGMPVLAPPTGKKVFQFSGNFGVYKKKPIFAFEENEMPSEYISKTKDGEYGLYKANINKNNESVVLTDYEKFYSKKVGWIYGSRFGNLTLYTKDTTWSEDSNFNKMLDTIKTHNDVKEIWGFLFIPPIDDNTTRMINDLKNSRELEENEFTPWDNLMSFDIEFSLEDIQIDDGKLNVFATFHNILIKYYTKYVTGITKGKMIDLVRRAAWYPQPGLKVLQKFNERLRELYKYPGIDFNDIAQYEPYGVTAASQLESDVDKKYINNLYRFRQEQEIYYKEITELFSSDHKDDSYNYIPFNIDCFFYGKDVPSDVFINRYIGSFDEKKTKKGKFNRLLCRSLSYIMYNLFLMGIHTSSIYRGNNIHRCVEIHASVLSDQPVELDSFDFEDIEPEGYSSFYRNYFINSLLDPVILARLLAVHVNTSAIIMLRVKARNDDGTIDELDFDPNIKLDGHTEIESLNLNTKTIKAGSKKTECNDFIEELKKLGGNLKCEFKGDDNIIEFVGDYSYIDKDEFFMIYMHDNTGIGNDVLEDIYDKNKSIDGYGTLFSNPSEQITQSLKSLVGKGIYDGETKGYANLFYRLAF